LEKKTSATSECEIEEESVYHTIFLTALVLLTTEQKSKNKITKKRQRIFFAARRNPEAEGPFKAKRKITY
jgi:hypothetical protein